MFVAAVDARLPRLSGPEDSSLEVVAAYRSHQAALAPLGLVIDEVRLSPRRAWRLRLDNGMQLALGREQTDARLARFAALYPRLFSAQQPAALDATLQAATATAAAIVPVTVDLRRALQALGEEGADVGHGCGEVAAADAGQQGQQLEREQRCVLVHQRRSARAAR